MPRGRTPKPTALKKLEGNPGKRAINDREPRPSSRMPDRPAGLSGPARKAWDRLAPQMHQAGILTPLDRDGLESYCRMYDHARRCWREAKNVDMLVEQNGVTQRNAYLAEADRAEQRLHKLRSELGLNATSRSRIRVEKAESESDLDAFLNFTT